MPITRSRSRSRSRSFTRFATALAAAIAAVTVAATPALARGTARPGADRHVAVPGVPTAAGRGTVVSLTFDDGFADELAAVSLLARYRMQGTFYVSSGLIGAPNRLTVPDLRRIQQAGNEIGGHTVIHAELPTVSDREQQREICDDRLALTRMGLQVTNFAYPYGAGERIASQVRGCGYATARVTGGLGPKTAECQNCVPAERLPPADPYQIRAVPSVVTGTPVRQIIDEISAARASGGGWVPLVFHHVCANCGNMAVAPADLDALLRWLSRQDGIAVRTVAQAVPLPSGPVHAAPSEPRVEGALINASLARQEARGTLGSAPSAYCWRRSGYGTNAATWSRGPVAGSASWAETVNVSSWSSGDQKLLVRQDLGECAPSAVPGHPYAVGAAYRSNVPTRFLVYLQTPNGHWRYWLSSPALPASPGWRRATWTTPALPEGVLRLSFGLQLARVGRLSVSDFTLAPATSEAGSDGESGARPGGASGAALSSSKSDRSTPGHSMSGRSTDFGSPWRPATLMLLGGFLAATASIMLVSTRIRARRRSRSPRPAGSRPAPEATNPAASRVPSSC